MLLTIHDANLQKVAFVDNSKQNTLNYYGDTWVRSLPTGSSTFEFTVFKKAIKSDTALTRAYQHLNERAWVSFKHKGKSFIFNVMTVEEDEQTIKCYCENLNLELINELANPYKATKAMTFVEYCEALDLLNYTHLVIGINEVSDKKRTIEWQGQETKLARLLSLAKHFDAEIEFDTQLNADSTIKKFSINVYHENDDNHQGVGRIRNDIQLKYGKNIKSIRRKVDKTGIFNSIRPTGKRTVKSTNGEDVEEVVTMQGLNDDWKKYDKNGVCEFYQLGEFLVAPISMQLYPSTFSHSTGTLDQYTRKDFTYDTDNPKELRTLAYKELKKHCYPAITYEVDGYVDVEIGDTVKIHDAGFAPLLNIQARVSEQHISFSNPASNKTVFSNFKALENQLSDGIQEAFERLFEQSKPYTIRLSTSNGIIFKNNSGESIITPTLYKGGKLISAGVTWRWSLNDKVTTGMTYTVRGQDIANTVNLAVAAYIDNDRVAVDEVTIVNVSDGRIGAPGKSSHIHFAFSENADGSGLSLIDNGQRYYGYYTDEQEVGSTDKTMYKWFDRWAKISVGGKNYIRNASFLSGESKWDKASAGGLAYNFTHSTANKGKSGLHMYSENGSVIPQWKGVYQKISLSQPADTPVTVSALIAKDGDPQEAHIGIHFRKDGVIVRQSWLDIPTSQITDKYQRFSLSAKHDVPFDELAVMLYVGYDKVVNLYVTDVQLEIGTVMTDFRLSDEDMQESINSKADQGLTQEQLNALSEKAQIYEAELKAKASMDAFSELEKAYNTFVQSNAEAQEKSEADLIEASRRIELLTTEFGGMKELKTFIDTFMSFSNEGMIIGKSDASSTIKVSHDRISMLSAGKEVMYISQGVIHIDNGIFTASIQVGRFREEQYNLNADVNIIRYVGGV
nr:MAG TPA: tail protein [Caudoviricetes sp.]